VPPVLLIGWQAADWKLLHPLLDAGLMPNLQTLLSRGVMSTSTSPLPLVPELLWTSLATGRRAAGHGILSGRRLAEPKGEPRALLSDRNCPAFWDLLKIHGARTHLVNWPLSDPAEETGGVCVSDAFFDAPKNPAVGQAVFPVDLGSVLAGWRVEAREVDLETIRFFVPDFLRVDQENDDRLRRIARAVARALSVQAVTTWLMENRPWEVTAVRFELIAELARWALPLAAPKMEAVGQLEFEIYQHVLPAACRMLDLMLGGLMKTPEAVVALVSDHGLLLGDSRPTHAGVNLQEADTWRRRQGIFVLSGAPTRPDEVIFGAHLLDLAPTLLATLGLPGLAEFEGRVLAEAFTAPLPAPREPLPLPWPARTETGGLASSGAGEKLRLEQLWNLARSRLDGRQVRAAAELIEILHAAQPENLDFLQALFECRLALGNVEEARQMLELLLDYLWDTPQAALLQARLEYAARRFDRSLAHLETIDPGETAPQLHLRIGLNLIKLNRSAQARAAFARELEIQPESAEAHAGLAYCCLRAGEFEPAMEHALAAISFNYQLHHAHFIAGLAQARMGEREGALVAFRVVTALAPEFAPAHRCLAILYGYDPARQELSRRHRELAQSARDGSWGF
jgi:thioredoxin-like negative regulator of GroEL